MRHPLQSTLSSFDSNPADGDYRVLDVDYDRLAVVYSCTQLAFLKFELGWILTRDPVVNQSVVSRNDIFTGCLSRLPIMF